MRNIDNIGKSLTALCGSKKQEEVAKDLNISLFALKTYESGKRVPRDEIKVRLAQYYNVFIDDIFF